jgi:hypothetical protein
VVRSGDCPNYEEAHKKVALSYEVEKIVMDNHLKAFVGVAVPVRFPRKAKAPPDRGWRRWCKLLKKKIKIIIYSMIKYDLSS